MYIDCWVKHTWTFCMGLMDLLGNSCIKFMVTLLIDKAAISIP